MADNGSGGSDKLMHFLVGAGVGAVVALLLAPKSGRETRDMLSRTANGSKDFVTHKVSEGRHFMEEKGRKAADDFTGFFDKSKEAVSRQKEQLTAAFEAGKAAYREEKGIVE